MLEKRLLLYNLHLTEMVMCAVRFRVILQVLFKDKYIILFLFNKVMRSYAKLKYDIGYRSSSREDNTLIKRLETDCLLCLITFF